MKHLKKYNESKTSTDILQNIEDICLELEDLNFKVGIRSSELLYSSSNPYTELINIQAFPLENNRFSFDNEIIDVLKRLNKYLLGLNYKSRLYTINSYTSYDDTEFDFNDISSSSRKHMGMKLIFRR